MNQRIGRTLGTATVIAAGTFWIWHSTKPDPKRFRDTAETTTVPRVISRTTPPPAGQALVHQPPPPSTPQCFAPQTWTIDAEFATFYGLTEAEVVAVNAVLENTIDELNELELKHLTIDFESPEKSVFRIEPFSQDGEALKQKAFLALAEAMPAKAIAATAVQQSLAHRGLMARSDFGGRATEFKVTSLTPPTNERFRYEVYRREFLSPTPVFETRDPHMPAGSIVSEEVLSFTAVPERLKHLLQSQATGKE